MVFCREMYSFRLFEFKKILNGNQEEFPFERSGHRVVIDRDCRLYMLGGYTESITCSNCTPSNVIPHNNCYLLTEFWSCNLVTNKWRFHDEISYCLPESLSASLAAIVPFPNNIFVFGGTGYPFSEDILSDIIHICVKTKIVETLPNDITTPLPYPVYGSTIFFHENYIYTIGGTNGTLYTMDIHRYDIMTGKWEILSEDNNCMQTVAGRYRHEIVFDGEDRIYVFGGASHDQLFGFAILPVFNLQTRKWEKKKTIGDPTMAFPFPRFRKFNSTVHFKNEIGDIVVYVFAGCCNRNIILSDLWQLNLSTFRWTKIRYSNKTIPNGTYFHSAAVTSFGKMYVFGGVGGEFPNLYRVSDFHTIWLQIPKLSEICWEALQFYIPISYFVSSNKSLFRNLGVPEKFISRL